MAVSVNWLTGEILVPRADLPLLQASPEVREFDTDKFFDDLKNLEASVGGIIWPDTQAHNSEYTIAGITYAQSLEIIPPYFVTFEDGQYAVTLTKSNNNIIQVATPNQVRILGNNSGGLINPSGIDRIDQWVWFDPNFPIDGNGTQQAPFNNAQSAANFLQNNSLRLVKILGDAPLDRDWQGIFIQGIGYPALTMNGFGFTNVTVRGCRLSGTASSMAGVSTEECEFEDFTGLDGHHTDAGLSGTVTLAEGAAVTLAGATHSDVAGLGRPTLDMNAASAQDQSLSVRGFSGGLIVANSNRAGNTCTVEVAQGRLRLASSCTAGVISVRGLMDFEDLSAGATVDTSGLFDPGTAILVRELMEADQFFDKSTGLLHYYRRGTTVDLIPPKQVTGELVPNDVSLLE